MEATEASILFCGPWGSGKTRLMAEKAYYLCGRYPGYKAALVRRDLVHLRKTTWKELIEKTIPPWIMNRARYNKSELDIRFPNGAEICGCGLDESQKLASTEFSFIGVEEAIEIQDEDRFSWVEGRCRQPFQTFHQVMYACNAGAPAHYLYQRFYMRKFGAMNGDDRVIEGETLWPILPASYRARMGMLKGRYRERFLENRWVGYEGLVYDVFDPGKMMIDREEAPKDMDKWDYVVAVDFGFNHPFVCQLWAVSPDDVWYLDKEIYQTGRTINSLSTDINKMLKGKRVIDIFSDHDAEDQATLEEHGISTQNAQKEVSPGIQTVYNKMEKGQIKFFSDALVEKDPVLEMKGRPTCSVEEIQGYVWAEKSKESPKKERDDGMDTMRYAMHSYEHRDAAPGFFFAGRA